MPNPPLYITTSWDDGHELDLRLASELRDHGIAGTFYVAPRSRELPESRRLSQTAMHELAEGFEIGGHTLTHPRLPELTDVEARREITDGKEAVEDMLGRAVTAFCYPYGAYSETHPAMVKAAGFSVARTVERFCTAAPRDLFRMGTTTHAYRHLVDGPQILRRARSPRHALQMWRNWDLLNHKLLRELVSTGGVLHLWGHSWEIDVNNDWGRLRTVLRELADQDATFVTNGQLAAELHRAA